jgi:hypothetical protein
VSHGSILHNTVQVFKESLVPNSSINSFAAGRTLRNVDSEVVPVLVPERVSASDSFRTRFRHQSPCIQYQLRPPILMGPNLARSVYGTRMKWDPNKHPERTKRFGWVRGGTLAAPEESFWFHSREAPYAYPSGSMLLQGDPKAGNHPALIGLQYSSFR